MQKGELMALNAPELQTVMCQQIFVHKNKWMSREMEEGIERIREGC